MSSVSKIVTNLTPKVLKNGTKIEGQIFDMPEQKFIRYVKNVTLGPNHPLRQKEVDSFTLIKDVKDGVSSKYLSIYDTEFNCMKGASLRAGGRNRIKSFIQSLYSEK